MIYILLTALSLLTGFFSGLVGIGGGIIMAPLLLFVPPLFGFPEFSMKTVAGLTMVQGLISCGTGSLSHKKFKFVSGKLALYMGVPIFITSFIGGAGSKDLSNHLLLIIFAAMALFASLLMIRKPEHEEENPDIYEFSFKKARAITVASVIGLLGGLVGQGGSFILIPLMIHLVNVPTRIAIGSNLAIILLSCSAGFIGKALTGQIQWLLAIPIVLAVIPATVAGSAVSKNVPVEKLRMILAIIIAIAAIRIISSALN